jgi:Raf kinase inhibitor-like YbhB/YbcL family protein
MAEMGFTLTCPAFRHGGPIPASHTCDTKDTSPELHWSHAPPDTGSLVLIMDDPDAAAGTFTHWVLFDIPTSVGSLSEREASIGVPGRNDMHREGYAGPCPPPRGGEHRYFFRLYALDVPSLGLPRGAARREVEEAMRSHILDDTELMGLYKRR